MTQPEHQRRFEQALATEKPFENLCKLAVALRDEGVSQTDIYFLFEHHQEKISGEDPLYDAIVDTMDEIHGGPWAKGGGIFTTTLTDEVIRAARGRS